MTGLFRITNQRARAVAPVRSILRRLPTLEGRPLRLRFQPDLTAWRGKLLSRQDRGTPVHAASQIRLREMVLDSGLLRRRSELERIFVHEIHHFVWVRLSNATRRSFEDLLHAEFPTARGELGWSAEGLKVHLTPADRRARTRRWRAYVCESFCDTAAWFYSSAQAHSEWTLAARYRLVRRHWFQQILASGPLSL